MCVLGRELDQFTATLGTETYLVVCKIGHNIILLYIDRSRSLKEELNKVTQSNNRFPVDLPSLKIALLVAFLK